MTREIFQNSTSDSLSASCLAADTTITVTTGSKFPSTGNFRLLIESETLLCTGRSGNTLTVTRGVEGTTAAAHGSGQPVTLILTAGSLQAYLRDNVPSADGSKPPYRLIDASGNRLTSADFTAVNTTNVTVSDLDDAITLVKATQGAVTDTGGLSRAYTAPATVIAGFRALWPNSGSAYPGVGLGFRDSVSGKLNLSFVVSDPTWFWQTIRFLDPTSSDTAGTAYHFLTATDTIWLKAEDDGTNLIFSASIDGVTWIQLASESRTAYVAGGPDEFFIGVSNRANTFEIAASLLAWQEG